MSTFLEENFETRRKALNDPSMVAKLYFCGTLEHPERIEDILKNGFAEKGRCIYILSRATYPWPGAPSFGGVRTWVEGSQTRGNTNYVLIKQHDYQYIRLTNIKANGGSQQYNGISRHRVG